MRIGRIFSEEHLRVWIHHYDHGNTAQSESVECYRIVEEPAGGWHTEPFPPSKRRRKAPPRFTSEVRRWQHFAKQHGVREFYLRHQWKFVRFNQAGTLQQALPSWTFSIALPTPGLGSVLHGMTFDMPQPPGRRMRRLYRLLLNAPFPVAHGEPDGPILFDGDLLLHFMRSNPERLLEEGRLTGRWRRMDHHGFSQLTEEEEEDEQSIQLSLFRDFELQSDEPESAGDQHVDSGKEGDGRREPTFILPPDRLHFVPRDFESRPDVLREGSNWRALEYRAADNALLLFQHPGRYLWYELPTPLYRILKKLIFVPRIRGLVLGDMAYRMPDALWLPPTVEKG